MTLREALKEQKEIYENLEKETESGLQAEADYWNETFMTDDCEKIEFLASFPPIQSAIRITGNGDGMRIQLDIPETELGAAARLILMRECVLKVTVEMAELKPPYGSVESLIEDIRLTDLDLTPELIDNG